MRAKLKLTHHQMEEVRRRKELGELCRFLARSYGVSPIRLVASNSSDLKRTAGG